MRHGNRYQVSYVPPCGTYKLSTTLYAWSENMKRIILLIFYLACIGTLIGGNMYWNHKVKVTAQNAKQSLNKEIANSSSTGSTQLNNKEQTGSITESSENSTEDSKESSKRKINKRF